MNESATPTIPGLPVLDADDVRLVAGDRVDVRNRFDGSWSSGFEIADVLGPPSHRTYRIRRLSDGEVLPLAFEGDSVTESRPPTRPGFARPIASSPLPAPALGAPA